MNKRDAKREAHARAAELIGSWLSAGGEFPDDDTTRNCSEALGEIMAYHERLSVKRTRRRPARWAKELRRGA